MRDDSDAAGLRFTHPSPSIDINQPTHHLKQPLPEVRLSLELMGPLRREFRFLSDVVAKYYSTVDRAVDGAVHAVRGVALLVCWWWRLGVCV